MRVKVSYAISALGVVGLFSPSVGFLIAALACVVANDVVTAGSAARTPARVIAAIVCLLCVANAALGSVIRLG